MSGLALWLAVAAALGAAAGFLLGRRRERGRSQDYELALDALPYPAQLLAGGGRVVYANAKCRQSFEAGDKPLPVLLRQQVVGEPAARELDRLAASGDAGKLDLAVATALGETSWREVSVQPLAGRASLALWLCRETGAERRTESALRPLVEALEKPADGAAAKTPAKPHEGADRLEAQLAQTLRLQAVGQLAGGIAHDFNNLLTAMIGFCDLLLLRHRPGDQSFADVMQIRQNANRAASLVRQLLAYSRQQTLQPHVISLAEVLGELAHLLRRLIGANIALKLDHGRDLHPVLVDQGQLEQVVINLAVNARDAMPEGGTLTIRTQNATLAEAIPSAGETVPPGNYVRIDVVDTGTGIPPEIVDRIFEPFFSTKPIGQGTGLGLSTVYGIVRQSGGYIVLDTKPGHGTTFMIYLPRYAAGTAAAARREGEEETARDLTGAGTILLVEDEDAVRLFGARALRNKGYKVIEARSGEAALDILAQDGEAIDLLITDVVMPEMDGPALVDKVKADRPDIKVLFISGYAETGFRQQAKDSGALQFLAKPFSLKQLAGKVKDMLEAG